MDQFAPPDNTPPGLAKPAAYNQADEAEWVEPPSWPTAVGVVSIILGSLFTLCGFLMPLMPMFMKSFVPAGEELPPSLQFSALQWGLGIAGWLFSIVLLIGGIACVRRSYVARWLHLAYALFGFIATPLNIMIQVGIHEKMKVWVAEHPKSPFAQGQGGAAGTWGVIIGIVMTLLISLAWPSFCAIWFGALKRRPVDFTGTISH